MLGAGDKQGIRKDEWKYNNNSVYDNWSVKLQSKKIQNHKHALPTSLINYSSALVVLCHEMAVNVTLLSGDMFERMFWSQGVKVGKEY